MFLPKKCFVLFCFVFVFVLFCFFAIFSKNGIFSKTWYQKQILCLISIPEMYTFIYIIVIKESTVYNIFHNFWVDTPLHRIYGTNFIKKTLVTCWCEYSLSIDTYLQVNSNQYTANWFHSWACNCMKKSNEMGWKFATEQIKSCFDS